MNLRHAFFTTAIVGLCACTQAWAADASGTYIVHGIGGVSCGEYFRIMYDANVNISDAEKRTDIGNWIGGYLTFYNKITADTTDITGGTDNVGIMTWVYNYCGQHPTTALSDALDALVSYMWPRRLVYAPKP